MDGDRIFKFLLRCNRQHNVPDMHSFTATIKGGVVYVECRGYETYVESTVYDKSGHEHKSKFVGTTIAAANRLEMLQMNFDSIDM